MTNNENNGGLSWGNRLFLIFWSALLIVLIATMALIWVTLIPHFGQIGDWSFWLVRLGMICTGSLMVAGTLWLVSRMFATHRRSHLYSRVVVAGDVVAALNADGTWMHLSAHHQAAGLLPQQALSRDEEDEPPEPKESDDATIIELYNSGLTLQNIAQSTGATYYRCQKVVAQAKKRGLAS